MKKIISILMSVLLIFSIMSVGSFAQEDVLKMDVVTDVHNSVADNSVPTSASTEQNPFGHIVSNGKMVVESRAITESFLSTIAQNDSEFLLITGDISDKGKKEEVETMVNYLENFEAQTGKTVFCVMGNHETYGGKKAGLTSLDFKNYYANLGYDKALAIDEKSASYTADLNDNYRLLAIDSNKISQDLINWIDEQVKTANEDGKKLISASHFPLFKHYIIQSLISDSYIPSSFNMPDRFIDWGIKYNFSGHIHELDIASYANDKGTVYDIVSGTLNTYPSCYRTIKITDEQLSITTNYIKEVDTSLIPDGLCEEALNLIKDDYRAYARKAFVEATHSQINDILNIPYIMAISGLNKEKDKDIIDILEKIVPRLNEAITMPLYGENSLSAIAEKDGKTIAKSDYKDALYVFSELYCRHSSGDENTPTFSTLGELVVDALAPALKYTLEPLTQKEFKAIFDWLVSKTEYSQYIPESVIKMLSATVSKDESIEYLVVYLITPIINDFSVDTLPLDANVTLTAYSSSQTQVDLNFWEKVIMFFRSIASYLHLFLTKFVKI